MDSKDKLAALQAEYFKLQDIIELFDSRALQIKGWSVTLSLAGLVAAFANKDAAEARMVVILLAVMSAICFWVIEYIWKCHQWSMLARVDAIEAAMRDGTDSIVPFQIATTIRTGWRKVMMQRLPMLAAPTICLPHLLIVVLGLALAGALPPGPMIPR